MKMHFFTISDGDYLATADMQGGQISVVGPRADDVKVLIHRVEAKYGLTEEELFPELPRYFKSLISAFPDGAEKRYGFTVPEAS